MLSDGTGATVEEGATEQIACRCCGAPTTVVEGVLRVGDLFAGWYTVGVTLGTSDHLPLLRLFLGDWGQDAGPDERWGLRIGIDGDGPSLIDWSDSDRAEAAPTFTPLDRAQVLGTPMERQVFALVDTILTQDTRL